ncbi:hypothetical protein BpHYR1_029015 [Brachionus plicatilis]|uniref:Uncharacterized protein n=1 Tax=Brachionus plicatilis TaxID=10195 RepID=A0A3M7SW45_BRAPC|nr:hypothetical protein BpHYR1_029015 [Brachionus plicatilis]
MDLDQQENSLVIERKCQAEHKTLKKSINLYALIAKSNNEFVQNFELFNLNIFTQVDILTEYKEGFESRYIEYPTPLCNCYLTISSFFPET